MIGGLATTNMLRLLNGNTLGIFSAKCYCQNCGMKIVFFNQLPIVSYIASRGKCRQCKTPIPVSALILEIVIFAGMSAITSIFHFSYLGVVLSFCFYEIVKIVLIIINGRRENEAFKQYIFSVIAMIPFFMLLEFMALLINIV